MSGTDFAEIEYEASAAACSVLARARREDEAERVEERRGDELFRRAEERGPNRLIRLLVR